MKEPENIHELRKMHDGLKLQFQQRTAKLVKANKELQNKIIYYKASKNALKTYVSHLEELNHIILQQNAQIVAIHRILANLNKVLTLDEACTAITSALKNDMNIEQIVLGLKGEKETFRIFKSVGLDQLNSEDIRQFGMHDKAVQFVFNSGTRLGKIDLKDKSTLFDRIFTNYIIWPLKAKQETLGILIIDDPGPERRDAVAIFLNQAGIFLENVFLYENLVAANKKLRDLDRQKSEFLNMVAHDLRTPLTSIMSYSNLLLMYRNEPREIQEEFLETIKEESVRLGDLINDFLDLSRIETGTIKYVEESFAIENLIRHFISVYEGETKRRDIALTAEIESDLPKIIADRNRIGQVLSNLLSNAVKFTLDGGRVHVQTKLILNLKKAKKQPEIKISITDNGPGIDSKYHQKIFDKFAQIEDRKAKHKGGTGLGLCIAGKIVKHHGGEIWVESKPGKGARFIFTLPVKKENGGYGDNKSRG